MADISNTNQFKGVIETLVQSNTELISSTSSEGSDESNKTALVKMIEKKMDTIIDLLKKGSGRVSGGGDGGGGGGKVKKGGGSSGILNDLAGVAGDITNEFRLLAVEGIKRIPQLGKSFGSVLKSFDKLNAVGERLSSKMKAGIRIAMDTKFGKSLLNAFDKISEIGERLVSKFKAGWRLLANSKAFKQIGKSLAGIGKYIVGVIDRLTPGIKKLAGSIFRGIGKGISKIPGAGLVKKGAVAAGTFLKNAMGLSSDDSKTKDEKDKTDKKGKGEPKSKIEKMLKTANAIVSGLGKMAKTAGKAFKTVMKDIAEGVKAFGDTKVLKGAAALVILSVSLVATVAALKMLSGVSWESLAKAGVALLGLAGIAALVGALKGQIITGAIAIALLGASLWVAAKGFETFGELDWSAIGKGFVAILGLAVIAGALSFVAPFIFVGAAAIAALGISLIPFAIAMSIAADAMPKFAEGLKALGEIPFGDFFKIGAGLAAFGVMVGLAAPALIFGAIGIIAIGGALAIFGKAISIAAPGLEEFTNGLERLSEISGGELLKVAAGIGAIGLAMAAFGAGQAAAGLGNLVSRFLSLGSDTPVEQLIKIGKAGPGIQAAATGIQDVGESMKGLSDLNSESLKETVKAVNDFPWIKATLFAKAKGMMEVLTPSGGAKIGTVSKIESPDAGAQMNAYQASTADATRTLQDSANQTIVSSGGRGGNVTNTAQSVSYTNNNIPDRTNLVLMPAMAGI